MEKKKKKKASPLHHANGTFLLDDELQVLMLLIELFDHIGGYL